MVETLLTTSQLESIIETLLMNPVVYKRGILNYLENKDTSSQITIGSTDPENIMLAKEKFYEGQNIDISMESVKMQIKGDPYWIESYITPKNAKEIFGTSNALDNYRYHPTVANGTNYVVVTTNKAAGVDDLDNIKIAHLATILYSVKSVISSFSNGVFVQELNMVRFPVPESFKSIRG